MQAVTRRRPVHISVTLNYPTPHLKYNGESAWPGLVGCRRSAEAYLGPCFIAGGNARWTRWLIVILRGYSSYLRYAPRTPKGWARPAQPQIKSIERWVASASKALSQQRAVAHCPPNMHLVPKEVCP
jgi:hypothetical protein